jgi:hypothetical protein
MTLRIYRVVVRGRFEGLDDAQRRALRDAAPAHDIFESAFTPEGTLTYDHHLYAFNTRFDLRARGEREEAEAEVRQVALERTEALLAELGVRGTVTKVVVSDMADIWR